MEDIQIQYTRPPFYKRVLANVVDIMLYAVVLILLFLSCKAIVESTSYYKRTEDYLWNVQKESGLYVEYHDRLYDIVSYYDEAEATINAREHKEALRLAIDGFIAYLNSEELTEVATKVQADYDEYRLGDKMVFEDVPLFVRNSDGVIVENPDTKLSYKRYAEEIYAVYIDNYARGYIVSDIPHVYEYTRFQSNMIFFVEMPISFVLAGLLVFLLPPLIMKRGRKTIGKLLYKIGLVDSNCLNVKTGRYIARFCIFYIGEVFLSIFTLGAPLIISFTMMGFSKKRQGFPDYMLGIEEVDTTFERIYNSIDEIALEHAKKDNNPLDFKMEDRL